MITLYFCLKQLQGEFPQVERHPSLCVQVNNVYVCMYGV